jgi:hypothetical protein
VASRGHRAAIWVIAAAVLAASCSRPVASRESPEEILRYYLGACAAGDAVGARTVALLPEVPRVSEWKVLRMDPVRGEQGLLDEFRAAFAEVRKAQADIDRLRQSPQPGLSTPTEIAAAETRVAQTRSRFPVLFDLIDSGRAALFFGSRRFDRLTGPYELRVMDASVSATLWVYSEDNRKTGPFRVRMARARAAGEDSHWRIFDIRDRNGASILVREGNALPPGVESMDQLLRETPGSPAAPDAAP